MLKALASTLTILMLLTGCFNNGNLPAAGNEAAAVLNDTQAEQVEPTEQIKKIEPAEETEAPAVRQEINIKSVLCGRPTGQLTVHDLKLKYEQESTEVLMSLYNVKQNESFTFSFKADMSGIPAEDIISVHTDRKALTHSQIKANIYFQDSGSTVVVEPFLELLDRDGVFDSIWGNASAYYIRVNYDLESQTPLKLAKPVITPFTVKSQVPAPELDYVIDGSGSLKLTWKPVKGADGYKIYSVYSESMHSKINGAEEGYEDVFPSPQATVQTTEYDLTHSSNQRLDSLQNLLNPFGYYVTAYKGDQESNFGNMISIAELADRLPLALADPYGSYDKLSELPKKMSVQFLDESVADRDVIYNMDKNKIINDSKVEYRIKGTELKGSFLIFEVTEAEYKAFVTSHSRKDPNTGMAKPQSSRTWVAPPEVPTIIGGGKAGGSSGAGLDLVSRQRLNTKQQAAEGDEQLVPEPEILRKIGLNVNSAAEEYLARNMVEGKKEFSLLAFPELQSKEVLVDYLTKVIYQNPQILGVATYYYDYNSVTLHLEYNDSSHELKRKQKEISAEAQRIVQAIIHNGMSAAQKNMAIYAYLKDKTLYDDAASAAAQDSKGPFDAEINDAFTTYGIMVKKKGVCMSYASSYKMLADLAGLETIVVTGTLEGTPHAWIKVKIGSEWLNIDPTNGLTNTGIPYLLYNANDDTAAGLEYVQDDMFWLDKELGSFEGVTETYDYYVKNGLEVHSAADFTTKLQKLLKRNEPVISVRVKPEINEAELKQLTAHILGSSSGTANYGYGYNNYFVIWRAP
ncbi:transglutaminase domain-containing protein [Paenibacillus sp. HW567]|uniref:transglutaminase domain-containing protein n=1 Tax=Paenibacillus sp. HW567 TaxID=1034769 RepID=UPI0018DE4719|nr:transglutaminase domain-containing protein [Paenibacillus sp. HW567]